MTQSLADGSHSPPAPQDFLLEGLATVQQIGQNHERALVQLAHLFGPWDEALSVSELTAAKPIQAVAEVAQSDHVRSVGVINLSPITVQVGYGGNSASNGNGIPVAPMGYFVLPLTINELDLGAALADLEGLSQPARVLVIRFRRNQMLAAGTLSTQAIAPTTAELTSHSNPAFEVTNISQQLLAANAVRKGLAVENNSSNPITLSLGPTAAVAGHGIVLNPGGSWDGRISERLWTGAVQTIAAVPGPSLVAVVEV